MADQKTLIGQFLVLRGKNPDTVADPYDPLRESPLEKVLPNPGLVLSVPAPLPPPPAVTLSSPGPIPAPPKVTLGGPSVLPAPPDVTLDFPDPVPPPPPVVLSVPAVLPPEPAPAPLFPAKLPPPPGVGASQPAPLPAPPQVVASVPAVLPKPPLVLLRQGASLPPPPAVVLSRPAPPAPVVPFAQGLPSTLPPPPKTTESKPLDLPPPPEVKNQPAKPPAGVAPLAQPNSGYALQGAQYTNGLGAGDAGSQGLDPLLYERQLERTVRLGPGKLALHALTQVGLFAQNVYGTVWNPLMAVPPPVIQDLLLPAIDLENADSFANRGKTEDLQVQLGEMIDSVLDPTLPNTTRKQLTTPTARRDTQPQLAVLRTDSPSRGISQAFDSVANNISRIAEKGLIPKPSKEDLIRKSGVAFENGIIPMRLIGDNRVGFQTFRRGQGNKHSDDQYYVPLCFTDLRPVGDVFRSVYFRPLIDNLSEGFAPEWNKQQFFGRTDSVATYQSTQRTISLAFKLVAFGPEDVRTIYQKLHWLTSMVYPEYDNNLAYRSGPVVRMRVGDLINAPGPEGARGLPGIIESLDYDYSGKLWELKKDFKMPREVDVSLSFLVLHDVPIGRGLEGKFGGLGSVDKDGKFSVKDGTDQNGQSPAVHNNFRAFGGDAEESSKSLVYKTLRDADSEDR